MSSPADAAPFVRLRQLLTHAGAADSSRNASQLVMSPEFERVALSPGWRAQDRLAALAAVSVEVLTCRLPQREREVVIVELSRLAMRILWWEGLLGPGLAPEAAPDVAAAVLVEISAAGLLPEGPAGWMVLNRAKSLLQRQDVVLALRHNAPRRERLLTQLVAAEARLVPLVV